MSVKLGKNQLAVLEAMKDRDAPTSAKEIAEVIQCAGGTGTVNRILRKLEQLEAVAVSPVVGREIQWVLISMEVATAMPVGQRRALGGGEVDTEVLWSMYSVDMSDEEIIEEYELSHGKKPSEIKRTGGGVLAGPTGPAPTH